MRERRVAFARLRAWGGCSAARSWRVQHSAALHTLRCRVTLAPYFLVLGVYARCRAQVRVGRVTSWRDHCRHTKNPQSHPGADSAGYEAKAQQPTATRSLAQVLAVQPTKCRHSYALSPPVPALQVRHRSFTLMHVSEALVRRISLNCFI